MGKHSQFSRKLTDLVRSGDVDGQEPKEILKDYTDYANMISNTFRGKLRKITQILEKYPKSVSKFKNFSCLANNFQTLLRRIQVTMTKILHYSSQVVVLSDYVLIARVQMRMNWHFLVS